jgi:hypothetical protein
MSAISAVSSSHHHAAKKTSLLSSGAAGTKAAAPKTAAGAGSSIKSAGLAKLEKAVSDALQSVKSSSQADPNKAIQDALTKIFKSGPAAGDEDNADDSSASATNAGQSFSDILASFGVTASQFQNDVQAAVQKAGPSGQVSAAALFKSFSTGSTLDAVG